MANKYWASDLIGGTSGCLDLINPLNTDGYGTLLVAGDICEVDQEDMISKYIARSSSGAVEKMPDIIIPDVNPSDWWWELIERVPQDEGPVTAIVYANTPGAF